MDFTKYVVPALQPIKVVLWGEIAMGFLGVGLLLNSYMLVPDDSDFDAAAEKLQAAGFTPAPWSYGTLDPKRREENAEIEQDRSTLEREYAILNENSLRFHFPDQEESVEQVVLLRSGYVGLRPPRKEDDASRFSLVAKNAYCPDKTLLLESFVKTLLKGPRTGAWDSTLTSWSISYLFGQQLVEENALDNSDEQAVRNWFNGATKRWEGGLDRSKIVKGLPP